MITMMMGDIFINKAWTFLVYVFTLEIDKFIYLRPEVFN